MQIWVENLNRAAELRQFADYDEDELGSDRAAEILQTMDRLLLIVEGILADQGGT